MSGETQTTKTPDRFDLEQQLLECWKVVDDIRVWSQQGANHETLADYYEQKFQKCWDTFESLTAEGKIT